MENLRLPKAMEVKGVEETSFPLATLTEVQFGLATSREIAAISFYGKTPIQHSSQLSNARLGLPVKSGKCEACGTDKLVECEGHFGHIRLPTPIYHPSYVEEVKRILSRICLNCFKVKSKKSKKSLEDILQDGDQRAIRDDYNNEDVTLSDVKSFNDKMSQRKDGHNIGFKGTVANINVKEEPQVLSIPLSPFRGNDMAFKKCKGRGSTNMKSSKVIQGNCSSTFGLAKKQTKQYDLTQREASTPNKLLNYDQQCKEACPYCQVSCSGKRVYPDVTVKVVNNPEGIKTLELKISAKKSVPPGFWSFLDRYGYSTCNDSARRLLAYEALKILEQIPEKTLRTLGRDPSVKQPGALILECLPVPPNCVRIPDQWGKTTIMASDHATHMLKKIVSKVEEIRGSRYGRAMFKTHEAEAKELQSLCTQYLRVRGGPKVPGSVEPSFNIPGQTKASNGSFSKIWLEKIRDLFLKKSCGLSCRTVITGDAYRGINEIGIPLEVANRVTFEEHVAAYNKEKMQKIVDKGLYRTFVDKEGKCCSNEFVKIVKKVEIGEVINRRLQDGDIVFINRPPSTHKHSLQALRTYIHPGHSVIINPLICGPLGADFDGDCIHVFFPQTLESQAELSQLLSVDQQMFSSHGGETNLTLTTDTLLAAKLLFGACILNKTTMHQLSMWTSSAMPDPVLMKSHHGGPFWTIFQLLQMALPPGFNYNADEFSICNSEILSFDRSRMQLQSFIIRILEGINQQKGPKEAVKFLNLVECFLIEWLSMEGFSVGLDDIQVARDAACRDEFTKEIQTRLDAVSPLMKYVGGGGSENIIISQVQNCLLEVQDKIIKCISNHSSLVSMVEIGNARSANKLVQQLGFLGLQLFQGKKAFPSEWADRLVSHLANNNSHAFEYYGHDESTEVCGLVKSSFVNGLNPCEEFIHCLSSREGLLRQKMGLEEPGTLFKNLMALMHDLIICYDGTVRNACGKFLVQFQYGSRNSAGVVGYSSKQGCSNVSLENSSPAGEPVGILAATAIANLAYKAFVDSAQNFSPWDTLKETLTRRYNSAPRLNDRRVILHVKNCCCNDAHCNENAALIEEHLKKVPLKYFAVYIVIEYQGNWEGSLVRSPLIGHLQLDKMLLDKANLSMCSLLQNLKNCIGRKTHSLNGLLNNLILQISDCCNVAQKYSGKHSQMPCLHFALRIDDKLVHGDLFSCDDIIGNILDSMVNAIYPQLLETTVKGDDRIEAVNISWNHVGSASWVPQSERSRKKDGEIMVEVVVKANEVKKHSDAWRIVIDACLPLMHLLDTARCIPYSIHKGYDLLGITTSCHLIVQRLSASLKMIGKDVFREHLLLVSECMAYTGNIVGFNPVGYRNFYRSMKFPVPLTEGTLQMPIKCFQRAAERGVKDKISSAVASCSWGKRAPLGTGSDFEILWHDMATKEPPDQQRKYDVHDFLEIVSMVPCRKEVISSSLCSGMDFDNLKDDEALTCAANSPSENNDNVDRMLTSSWDSQAKSPVQTDGWGSKLDPKETDGLSGWHKNQSTIVSGWEVNMDSKGIGESENAWNNNASECVDKSFTPNWDSPAKSPIQTDGWGCSKLELKERDGINGWQENHPTSVSGWELNMNSRGEGESENGWDNGASECAYRRVEKVPSTGRKQQYSNSLGDGNMQIKSCNNEMTGSQAIGDSFLPPGLPLTVDLCGEENLMAEKEKGGQGNTLMGDTKNRVSSGWGETSTDQELHAMRDSHTEGWGLSCETSASKACWNDGWQSDDCMIVDNNACPIQSGWELPGENFESLNNAQVNCNQLNLKSKPSNAASKLITTGANMVPLGERGSASQNAPEAFISSTLQKDKIQELNAQNETESDGWNADNRSMGNGSCWEGPNKEMGEAQHSVCTRWATAGEDKQKKAWIGNLGDSIKRKNLATERVFGQEVVVYNDRDLEWNKTQEEPAPKYQRTSGWNVSPETSAGKSGLDDGWDSGQHVVTQNNSCPVESSWDQARPHTEFDSSEQVKRRKLDIDSPMEHLCSGHKLSNAAFKFKPTGANTVPLGKRSFGQNVPEAFIDSTLQMDQNQELYAQKETQKDGWNVDYKLVADGSCWEEPGKGAGISQNTVCTKQVNVAKNDQKQNDIQCKAQGGSLWEPETCENLGTARFDEQETKVHNDTDLEWNQNQEQNASRNICNDGWNPSPELSLIKSGWDADDNVHHTQCSWEPSRETSDPGFGSTSIEKDVKFTICRAATSQFTDQETVADAEHHNEKGYLSFRPSEEWTPGHSLGGNWHNEQRCVKSQGRGRGRGRDRGRGRGIHQLTVNRKCLDQIAPGEEEILQEVEPLMLSMRKILRSSGYKEGDRLTADDEKEVIERVLAHHPEKEAKVGDGVDFIMIDNHSNFESSRCFFIVRKDGSRSDFSYLKCIKQLVQEKFPALAETFIEKYFHR